jgi:hypothetical protein
VTGQTQQGTINAHGCDPGWDGCNYPEDLFYDGVPQKHIKSVSRPVLASGEWWFDYTNHVIYFHDTPSGHTVETSVLATMFNPNGVNGVTLTNLTVEEFAAPIQSAAINPTFGGRATASASLNWTIKNCYVTLNHGDGINGAFGMQILNSLITLNGQEGIGGGMPATAAITPSRFVVQGNTITFNNYAHVDPGFGAGGFKVGNTAGAVVRGNTISNNLGNGLHFDVDSISPLIDGNTVTNNFDSAATSSGDGIRFEIGNVGATVRNNVIRFNGASGTGASSQMSSASSAGAQMYCNVVEMSNSAHENGFVVAAGNRGNNTTQPFLNQKIVSIGNYVHHNTVIWDNGSSATVGYTLNDAVNQPNFFADNTPPDYNTYHISDTTLTRFIYDNDNTGSNTHKTFAQFQAAGADVHGTIDTNYTSGFPVVAITSPADQSSVANPVMVAATASDTSGISKVEFYVDWNLQATVTSSPYNFNWSNGAAGSHTVAAMAYSSAGIRSCYGVTLNVQ